MKLLSNILVLSFSAFTASASWVSLDDVVGQLDSYAYGSRKTDTNSLLNLTEGEWNVYYGRSKWREQTQPYGSGSMMLPAGGSDGSRYGSQLATRFQFGETALAGADKARISFDLNYIKPEAYLSLGININDWFQWNQGVDLRSAATNRSLFRFGLQNLTTGDFMSANIYQNGALLGTLDNGTTNWFFPDDKIPVTFSFEMDASQVNPSDQFALVMSNDWQGASSSDGDLYYINNLKVEVERSIPEPSSLAVMFAGGIVLLARRRRV